jgi:hypothetical protein
MLEFSALSPMLKSGSCRVRTRLGKAKMSLNVFLAVCVLGSDFMIYALFHCTYSPHHDAF